MARAILRGATILVMDEATASCDAQTDAMIQDTLHTVFARSTVLTLHCELTPATRGLLDARAIATLPRGAVLVNTARGALVDVDAAMSALREGHLAGVGLDVFPAEPAPLAALRHPRAILTPHAAGWHPALGARVTEGIEAALRALHAGEAVPWTLHP